MRKKASETKWSFFKNNAEQFDRIYDDLVKVRDTMAKKLGYKNYIELAYTNLKRTDYNAEDVAAYRKQILETIVPVAQKLREKQQKRLGLDKLYYYDEAINFATGNATPKGTLQEILDNTLKMYEELSPETGEFFQLMYASELMDLENKKGKAVGGYSQVCAFQFWKKVNAGSKKEHTAAMKDYIKLCKAGGSQSFLDLLEFANLESPFKKDTVKNAIKPIIAYLDSVDDAAL
ncbi:unnamed protein product [Rotaria sp. Silwood1]|nr:unnamed protein product [Rotaria sp. Silwood1]